MDRRDVMAVLERIDSGEVGLELVEYDSLFPIVRTPDGWCFEVFTDDESPSSGFDYINRFKPPGSDTWDEVGETDDDPVLWYEPINDMMWISVWLSAAPRPR